ncbi:hypothetical protein [Methylorubrum populi]
MTASERDRLAILRKSTKRSEDGSWISTGCALLPAERERFAALRADLDARLAPAADDEDRAAVHDRLHAFLMGFSQLRALDAGGSAMMLNDFVEAVEGLPVGVVHRACRGWNQRHFAWPNYSFPPTPPDMRRAADEMRTEMKVERYDLNAVLLAAPAKRPDQPTQEERDKGAARAAALITSIAEAGKRLDEDLSAAAKRGSNAEHLEHVRRFQAAEAERKARIAREKVAAAAEGDEGAQ